MIKRREFIVGLGGTAAMPFAARGQQQPMPVIGWLNPRSAQTDRALVAALHRGLREQGFIEGQNLAIEYRWADGQYARLPGLAADLVRSHVAVIVVGSPPGVAAAKAATANIPIVFTSGGDPVAAGFVASLNRPGGNLAGVHILATELEAKRLEILGDVVPQGARIAMLVNPDYKESAAQTKNVEQAARVLGLSLSVLNASIDAEIAAAFKIMSQDQVSAFLIATDPFFNSRHEQIVSLAAQHSLPAIYPLPEYAQSGGLMSNGTSIADAYHQCGRYAGRILKREKPGEMPVAQSTKVELVINMKAAKNWDLGFPWRCLGAPTR